MKLSRIDCITCKGRFCKNYQECPIYSRARVLFKSNNIASKDITGQSPAPFVGHYGYPKVSVGILAPPEKVDNPEMYDAPLAWADKDLQIPEIVKFRASLVNSRFPAYVKDRNNKMLEISKEVGMASKPVRPSWQIKACINYLKPVCFKISGESSRGYRLESE